MVVVVVVVVVVVLMMVAVVKLTELAMTSVRGDDDGVE